MGLKKLNKTEKCQECGKDVEVPIGYLLKRCLGNDHHFESIKFKDKTEVVIIDNNPISIAGYMDEHGDKIF